MIKRAQLLSAAAVVALGATSLVACVSVGDGSEVQASNHAGTPGVSGGADGAKISAPGAEVSGGGSGGSVGASADDAAGGTGDSAATAGETPAPDASPEQTKDTVEASPQRSSTKPTTTQTDQSWWTKPGTGSDVIPEGWPSGLPAAGGWEVFAAEGVECDGNTATFDVDFRAAKLLESCANIVVRGTGMTVVLTKPVDTIRIVGTGNEVAVLSVQSVTVTGAGNRVAYEGNTPAVVDKGTGNIVSTEPLSGPSNVG